jgi:Glutamate synthase domain 2
MVLTMAKALALGADPIAIGTGSMIAINCNKRYSQKQILKKRWV